MPEVLGTSKIISGFDPRSIGGCVVWLDGADEATKTLSSTTVTAWASKGSVSLSFTPAAVATEGSITVNGPTNVVRGGVSFPNSGSSVGNGEYAIGVSQPGAAGSAGVSTPGQAITLPTQATTVFVASLPTDNTGYRSQIVVQTAQLVPPMIWLGIEMGASSGGIIGLDYSGGTWSQLMQPSGTQYNSNAIQRVDCMMTPPGTTATRPLWTNGTNQTAVYSSTYTSTNSNYPINQIFIGGFTSSVWGSRNFNGIVYEVLMYDSALADTQRQAVEGYLAWKWGFQTSLATGHPYLSRPVFAKTFSPVDISGTAIQPRCWFDAADASKLVLSSGSVTTWSNKAGYANAGSAVGTVTNGGTTLNGTPGIRFAAGTSYLSIGSISYTTGYRNLFMVVAMPAASANTTTFLSANDGIGGLCISAGSSNSIELSKSTTIGLKVTSPTSFFSATSIVSICSAAGDVALGSVQGIWINGSNQTLAVNGVASLTNFWSTGATSALTLGGASGSQFDVYEVIQYDGAIPMSQRYQVEGYLARKWGLTSSLPATHPFNTLPPSTIQ